MKIEIPTYANTAIRLLGESGFKSYVVGGCVRDSLMGRIPGDWDMTTSAKPENTLEVFRSFRTIPTGLKHGTVTVLIEKEPVEITTMRIDGDYGDNRRPDSVSFTEDIETDLSRRDFTINAMAYNPETGIVDPFGGQDDIANGIVRCVGEPDRRFGEDALRILRALRFASVLGFEIEKNTADSIRRNYPLLSNVANERKRVELIKLLSGKGVEKVLSQFSEVIFSFIPELEAEYGFEQHTPYHIFDVWQHTIKVVGAIENTPVLRISALLHDVSKPETLRIDENGVAHFKGHTILGAEKAKQIMKNLRFSNAEINEAYHIICMHDDFHDVLQKGAKKKLIRLCAKHTIKNVRSSLKLVRADAAGKNPQFYQIETDKCSTVEKLLDEIEKEKICMKISDMEISGNELMALGLRGREISDTLSFLLSKIMDGELKNIGNELLEEAKKIKNK